MADLFNDLDDPDMIDFLQDSYGAEDDDDQYGIFEAFRARLKEGRIRRLAKRIARIYESGKESRAKKLAARLAKVVAKMEVLDPDWTPSEAVASWVAWGVGEISSPYVSSEEMEDGSPHVSSEEMEDGSDDSGWLDNLAQGVDGYTQGGGYAPSQGGYISTQDPQGYRDAYQQGYMTGQTYQPSYSQTQAIPKWARPSLQQGGGGAVPKLARPPQRSAIPQPNRPSLSRPGPRLGRVAPIRSGAPKIRFGEDDGEDYGGLLIPGRLLFSKAFDKALSAREDSLERRLDRNSGLERRVNQSTVFGLNQSDVFGGIFSLEKRLAAKQDAYERALNLGHARRAKNLLKDIHDLQAKMEEMEAMADVSMAAHIEGGVDDLGDDLGDVNFKDVDLDEINVLLS